MAGEIHLAALAEAAFHRLGDHESLVFEGRTYRSGELFDRACRRFGAGGLGVGRATGSSSAWRTAPRSGSPTARSGGPARWSTPVVFLLSEDELRHVLVGQRRGRRA